MMPRQKSIARLIAEPLLIAVVLAVAVRGAVSIYSIPSTSMMPSLQIGDHIVVVPYRWSEPRRGDVIVFRSPSNRSELMVKRIVAVGGDLIDSRAGRVRIGERTVAESYVSRQATTGPIAAQVVPEHSFFVMGDNRDDSLDSRRWGALDRSLIIGRVRMILWSSGHPGDDRAARASSVSAGKTAGPVTGLGRFFKCVD